MKIKDFQNKTMHSDFYFLFKFYGFDSLHFEKA